MPSLLTERNDLEHGLIHTKKQSPQLREDAMLKIVAHGLVLLSTFVTLGVMAYTLDKLDDMLCADEADDKAHEKADHA